MRRIGYESDLKMGSVLELTHASPTRPLLHLSLVAIRRCGHCWPSKSRGRERVPGSSDWVPQSPGRSGRESRSGFIGGAHVVGENDEYAQHHGGLGQRAATSMLSRTTSARASAIVTMDMLRLCQALTSLPTVRYPHELTASPSKCSSHELTLSQSLFTLVSHLANERNFFTRLAVIPDVFIPFSSNP